MQSDHIHYLNDGAPVICVSPAFIINLSSSTESFINDWKVAKVIPLYKFGNASEINNCQSISILSVLSKIHE